MDIQYVFESIDVGLDHGRRFSQRAMMSDVHVENVQIGRTYKVSFVLREDYWPINNFV